MINIKKPFVVIRTKGFEFVIPPITYILTYALPLTQEIRQSLLEQISFGLQLQSDIPKVSTVTGLAPPPACLLYTSDAADEEASVELGGSRIIKKKNKKESEADETP